MSLYRRSNYLVRSFFNRPMWVLTACIILAVIHMISDGTLSRMWHLYHSRQVLEAQITDLQQKNALVEAQMKRLADTHFLEKEAKDRLNMVEEHEMIFIFPDKSDPHQLSVSSQ